MPEQPLLAPMRRRGHQQRAGRVLRQQPADLVEGGRRRRETVRFVEDDKIPTGLVGTDGLLNGWIDRRELERHDPQIVAAHCVLADGVGGELAQAAAEESSKVGDPLGGEVGGADDDRPPDEAEALHLAQVQASHDRLACTGFVRKQEAQ